MRDDLLLNPNYRSYFDRHREIPEHNGAPLPPEDFREDELSEHEMLTSDAMENAKMISRISEQTESRLRAKRSKLKDSERLKVDWKLGERQQPELPAHRFASGLRSQVAKPGD